eukprot:2520279-Pleurochrysis_carterae.AAC.2
MCNSHARGLLHRAAGCAFDEVRCCADLVQVWLQRVQHGVRQHLGSAGADSAGGGGGGADGGGDGGGGGGTGVDAAARD